MGTDKHEEAAPGFRRPKDRAVAEGIADWENANAELLRKLIATAGRKHSALRFGYTRDGGAYSVGVYAGTEYFTDYIRPSEEIDLYLQELLESFEEFVPQNGNSTPQKRKSR
jgi:hypothetical protein